MQITYRQSPNHNKGRQGHVPDFIVMHTTGASKQSAFHTIMNRANAVSYHFVISSCGQISQFVDIADTAWATGTTTDGGSRDPRHSTHSVIRGRRANANLYTVNIGFGDMNVNGWKLTEAQLNSTVWLVKHVQGRIKALYGLCLPLNRERVIGHNEVVPRHRPNCPGQRFQWDALMSRLDECENEVGEMRYNTIAEIPEWARPTIQKLVERGILQGDGQGLDLSLDMVRMLVIIDRAGQFGS